MLDKLVDQLSTELGRQTEAALAGEADDQEGVEYSLEVTLRRLGSLIHQVCSPWPLLDSDSVLFWH